MITYGATFSHFLFQRDLSDFQISFNSVSKYETMQLALSREIVFSVPQREDYSENFIRKKRIFKTLQMKKSRHLLSIFVIYFHKLEETFLACETF